MAVGIIKKIPTGNGTFFRIFSFGGGYRWSFHMRDGSLITSAKEIWATATVCAAVVQLMLNTGATTEVRILKE